MEKITKASVTSRAVAEEKSMTRRRFSDLFMCAPLAAEVSQKDFTFS